MAVTPIVARTPLAPRSHNSSSRSHYKAKSHNYPIDSSDGFDEAFDRPNTENEDRRELERITQRLQELKAKLAAPKPKSKHKLISSPVPDSPASLVLLPKRAGRWKGRSPKTQNSTKKRNIDEVNERVVEGQSVRVRKTSKKLAEQKQADEELAEERTTKKAKTATKKKQKKKEEKAKSRLNANLKD